MMLLIAEGLLLHEERKFEKEMASTKNFTIQGMAISSGSGWTHYFFGKNSHFSHDPPFTILPFLIVNNITHGGVILILQEQY